MRDPQLSGFRSGSWSLEVPWASKKAVTSLGNSFDLQDHPKRQLFRCPENGFVEPQHVMFFIGKMMATSTAY